MGWGLNMIDESCRGLSRRRRIEFEAVMAVFSIGMVGSSHWRNFAGVGDW